MTKRMNFCSPQEEGRGFDLDFIRAHSEDLTGLVLSPVTDPMKEHILNDHLIGILTIKEPTKAAIPNRDHMKAIIKELMNAGTLSTEHRILTSMTVITITTEHASFVSMITYTEESNIGMVMMRGKDIIPNLSHLNMASMVDIDARK